MVKDKIHRGAFFVTFVQHMSVFQNEAKNLPLSL